MSPSESMISGSRVGQGRAVEEMERTVSMLDVRVDTPFAMLAYCSMDTHLRGSDSPTTQV